MAANERLAASSTRISTLERDLWVANSSLATSTEVVANLAATLESTKKLLESTYP
jgi:hypothetical protein